MAAADLRCQETFVEPASASSSAKRSTYTAPLVCRAIKDPVILEDIRVFHNMLGIEEFYVAATNYFKNNQSEIEPHMRKIVTSWMLDVSIFCLCGGKGLV